MKSSEWYNKLWRQKLSQLPVKQDAEPAWAKMRQLLDEQMPVKTEKPTIKSPTDTTLWALVVVIIAITAAVFFYATSINRDKSRKKKDKTDIQDSTNRQNPVREKKTADLNDKDLRGELQLDTGANADGQSLVRTRRIGILADTSHIKIKSSQLITMLMVP